MTKITSLSVAGALFVFGLSAAPAQAATRTFVSGHGADSGTCAFAAPCRTFAFALTQTAAGGEIDVLDPAGYGAVTITQAINIVNDGVGTAGILASSGNGVTINAGPSDSVHLRGLIIEGAGSGSAGILFNTGGNLAIENCVIRGFTNVGINIQSSTPSNFSVSNTIVSNIKSPGIEVVSTNSAAVSGVLSKVTTNNDSFGILVSGGGITLNVVDSVASYNNTTGLEADSTAVLRVARSVVTGNGTGVAASGGTIFSYGDNGIDGNANDNISALTPLALH
ncbi:MAG: right-handed parallel beta-helix repeat-containing protein [Methylocella sp.]